MQSADEVFNLCIQLSANDKISQRNAWYLPLIDCIDYVIDFEHCDFIRSAGAIQASAKIYSTRVDVLARHVECFYQGEAAKDKFSEQYASDPERIKVTARKMTHARIKRGAAEDLYMKLSPNAFFDSNFHQMFALGQTQLLGETELFAPLEVVYDCDIVEVPGMQYLLNKSQRFMDVSYPQPVSNLRYDACEADVMSASYASLLTSQNESAVEEVFPFSAFYPKKATAFAYAKVPRAARVPRQRVSVLAQPYTIKMAQGIAKTQSKFVLQAETQINKEYFFRLQNAVFQAGNVNRFLISSYRYTEMSKMPSVTELSVYNCVHFADNLTADEIDHEMAAVMDGSDDTGPSKPDLLSQSMQNSTFKYLEDQNLIQQRLTIGLNVITTKFARRPKRVDIAELKNCIRTEVGTLKQLDFTTLIDNYQNYHSNRAGPIEEVSVGMMFVGLLHLASESDVYLNVYHDGRIIVSSKK